MCKTRAEDQEAMLADRANAPAKEFDGEIQESLVGGITRRDLISFPPAGS